jgi:hypothetical protein
MGNAYTTESYTFCITCDKKVDNNHDEQHIIIKISIQMAYPPHIQNANKQAKTHKIIGCTIFISGKCTILHMGYATIRMCHI